MTASAMKLMILGGGIFLGAAALQSALAGGHRVTVFNRGRARVAWPAGVEVLTGDRAHDLRLLDDRHWDAVIDTCGYAPADVRASALALRGCGTYLFVSSVSAYATTNQVPVCETDALASAASPRTTATCSTTARRRPLARPRCSRCSASAPSSCGRA